MSEQVLDKLVCIYQFYDVKPGFGDSHALVEAVEFGWWYSALLPGHRMVIALMTDADLSREYQFNDEAHWKAALVQTNRTRTRSHFCANPTALSVRAAHSRALDSVADKGWLAVGDAAAAFDPLSSAGIFKAMRGGTVAAYAIGDYLKGDDSATPKYQLLFDAEYKKYLDKRAEYYGQVRRFEGAKFWCRRQLTK